MGICPQQQNILCPKLTANANYIQPNDVMFGSYPYRQDFGRWETSGDPISERITLGRTLTLYHTRQYWWISSGGFFGGGPSFAYINNSPLVIAELEYSEEFYGYVGTINHPGGPHQPELTIEAYPIKVGSDWEWWGQIWGEGWIDDEDWTLSIVSFDGTSLDTSPLDTESAVGRYAWRLQQRSFSLTIPDNRNSGKWWHNNADIPTWLQTTPTAFTTSIAEFGDCACGSWSWDDSIPEYDQFDSLLWAGPPYYAGFCYREYTSQIGCTKSATLNTHDSFKLFSQSLGVFVTWQWWDQVPDSSYYGYYLVPREGAVRNPWGTSTFTLNSGITACASAAPASVTIVPSEWSDGGVLNGGGF